jgi:hypothetical protein
MAHQDSSYLRPSSIPRYIPPEDLPFFSALPPEIHIHFLNLLPLPYLFLFAHVSRVLRTSTLQILYREFSLDFTSTSETPSVASFEVQLRGALMAVIVAAGGIELSRTEAEDLLKDDSSPVSHILSLIRARLARLISNVEIDPTQTTSFETAHCTQTLFTFATVEECPRVASFGLVDLFNTLTCDMHFHGSLIFTINDALWGLKVQLSHFVEGNSPHATSLPSHVPVTRIPLKRVLDRVERLYDVLGRAVEARFVLPGFMHQYIETLCSSLIPVGRYCGEVELRLLEIRFHVLQWMLNWFDNDDMSVQHASEIVVMYNYLEETYRGLVCGNSI